MNRDMIYLSNDGKGPLRARVLSWDETTVTMERWRDNSRRRVRFTLPLEYFLKRSGWVPARTSSASVQGGGT